MSPDRTSAHESISTIGPLDVELAAPPSKSLTIRAMTAAALAQGRSALRRPLFSDDTYVMARALGGLGVEVARRGSSMVVEGTGGRLALPEQPLDLRDAGTPLRLLVAVCCLGNGRFVVDGSARMRERPVRHLVEALQSLGVGIRSVHDDGCPPVQIDASGFPGGSLRLDGSISSQYLSALLMAAPRGAADLQVELTGRLVSRPYVDLTMEVMRAFGARVESDGDRFFRVVAGDVYQPRVYPIEGDASSATYFFAAAAIAGGSVRVTGIPAASKQGDLRFLDVIAAMGCQVTRSEDLIEVRREPDMLPVLEGFDADLSDMPDVAPTLAALAMFASGPSRLRNIAHLRHKESDRIAGMAACVRALGASAEPGDDSLLVTPPAGGASSLHGGDIRPFNDHRLAMAFALAGLRVPGVRVLDADCVAKSFPDFFVHLRSLC